jgi:hypothetical protein
MTGYDRRRHAEAAYAMLARSLDGTVADGEWAIELAARRLEQWGDPGLAKEVRALCEGWYPVDSEIRAMMARVGHLLEAPEPSMTVIGSLDGITGRKEHG